MGSIALEDLVRKIGGAETSNSDFWHALFFEAIVPSSDPNSDDLLYFVRKSPPSAPNGGAMGTEDILFVKRKVGKTVALTKEEKEDIRWKETFYLNLVVQLKCLLTVAICRKETKPDGRHTMNALSHVSKRVYASPNKTRMDQKGAEYSSSFPLIYFNVEDFEDAFSDIIINTDEYFCVELVVQIQSGEQTKRVNIFQGAVGWEGLSTTFKKKASTIKDNHIEYIMMRGPGAKGHAQVAVSIPQAEGSSSSSSSSLPKRTPSLIQVFRPFPFAAKEIVLEKLKCCLTFINVSWISIVNDLNSAILKDGK